MSQKIKDFLRPSLWKIFILVVFLCYVWKYSYDFRDVFPDGVRILTESHAKETLSAGLPLTETGFPFICAHYHWYGEPWSYDYVGLILDVALWYLLVCLIVFIFKRLKFNIAMRPNRKNIALTLLLFYVGLVCSYEIYELKIWGGDTGIKYIDYGFPLKGAITRGYYSNGDICSGDSCGGHSDGIGSFDYFMVDILFAYTIICLIMYILGRRKNGSVPAVDQVGSGSGKESFLYRISPLHWEFWVSVISIDLIMNLGRLWRLLPGMVINALFFLLDI